MLEDALAFSLRSWAFVTAQARCIRISFSPSFHILTIFLFNLKAMRDRPPTFMMFDMSHNIFRFQLPFQLSERMWWAIIICAIDSLIN